MKHGIALIALTLAGATQVNAQTQTIDKKTADAVRQVPHFACKFTTPPEFPRTFTSVVITNSSTLPIPTGKVIKYTASNNKAQSGTITLTEPLAPGKPVVEALKFQPNVGACSAGIL